MVTDNYSRFKAGPVMTSAIKACKNKIKELENFSDERVALLRSWKEISNKVISKIQDCEVDKLDDDFFTYLLGISKSGDKFKKDYLLEYLHHKAIKRDVGDYFPILNDLEYFQDEFGLSEKKPTVLDELLEKLRKLFS